MADVPVIVRLHDRNGSPAIHILCDLDAANWICSKLPKTDGATALLEQAIIRAESDKP